MFFLYSSMTLSISYRVSSPYLGIFWWPLDLTTTSHNISSKMRNKNIQMHALYLLCVPKP